MKKKAIILASLCAIGLCTCKVWAMFSPTEPINNVLTEIPHGYDEIILQGIDAKRKTAMSTAKRIIAFLVLMLSTVPSFSQERGFFRIYERDDKDFMSYRESAVELSDGSFIVATNGSESFQGFVVDADGELVKLSAEGELLRSVSVSEGDEHCKVLNIFPHPSEPDMFVGLGLVILSEGFSCMPPECYGHLLLFQFDSELNITERITPNWPEEF